MTSHEIDYKIYGEELQCVEVELDPQETVVSESGSFMMMEDGIQMHTLFGDGTSQTNSFIGKLFAAGKRVITGESLFLTAFTNEGVGKSRVTFAAPYPGKIIALNLALLGGKVVAQKDAFLCAARGVTIGIEFQRKLGTGLFGGEGFIMQKLEGDGMCFVHAGGYVVEKDLRVGDTLRIDTGCIVAYTGSVNFDIEFVKGIRNVIFGGEGMFYATLLGPGKVWIQTIPISRLASRILSYAAPTNNREQGGLVGGLMDTFLKSDE